MSQWQFMLATVILKAPFVENDEYGRRRAMETLQKIIGGITPAFMHDAQLTVVQMDKLPKNGKKICDLNDQRDCGCE